MGMAALPSVLSTRIVGTATQGDIGIRNRRHCIDIVKHIAELEPDAGLDSGAQLGQDARRRKNKVTLCVEGNISAGKSTFLQKLLKSSVELRDIIEVPSILLMHWLTGVCQCIPELWIMHACLATAWQL